MFTGIIEQVGSVIAAQPQNGNLTLRIRPKQMWPDLQLGESIACNGACLTVTAWDDSSFEADLSQETLDKTAANWQINDQLNLERAMTAATRFGGHMVSGHVDDKGQILEVKPDEGAYIVRVAAPEWMAKYLVPKGSITVDGISLTIVQSGGPAGNSSELAAHEFTLWLVPHTLEVTTLGQWQAEREVNLEADQVAKYLERLAAFAS